MFGLTLNSSLSTLSIQRCGLPLFVAINQHEQLLRIVYIFSLLDISAFKVKFDHTSPLDIMKHVLFTADIKILIGGAIGLVFGALISQWTKKIVRDNHNLIQLILGSFLILYSCFKLFGEFGSQFTALVCFTLTIKIMGFSKYKSDSKVLANQTQRTSSKRSVESTVSSSTTPYS
jgi:hypothetical protein